jgi:hypothetical protein
VGWAKSALTPSAVNSLDPGFTLKPESLGGTGRTKTLPELRRRTIELDISQMVDRGRPNCNHPYWHWRGQEPLNSSAIYEPA